MRRRISVLRSIGAMLLAAALLIQHARIPTAAGQIDASPKPASRLRDLQAGLFSLRLDDLRKQRLDITSSYYVVTNTGAAAAQVRSDFYTPAAAFVAVITDELAPKLAKLYNLASIGSLPCGYAGYAIVSADQPLDGAVLDLLPPAAVMNLKAWPGPLAGQVTLGWAAPGDDLGAGGKAASYEIAYSAEPLPAPPWGRSSLQMIRAAVGEQPGQAIQQTISGLALGKTWHFAVRAADEWANWSPASNQIAFQDSGFRPAIDGYTMNNEEFADRGAGDFTQADMRWMFGDAAVCSRGIPECKLNSPASRWYEKMVPEKLGRGRCDGIAVTSLRLFQATDEHPPAKPTTAELSFTDSITTQLPCGCRTTSVSSNVAYFDLAQFLEPVSSAREAALKDSLSTIWDKLVESFNQAGTQQFEPYILVLYAHSPADWWRFGISGHTLVPFALEERFGERWVWVYDSNKPRESSYILINPVDKTWRYSMADGAQWAGKETEHSIAIVSVAEYAAPLTAPWAIRRSK